MISDRSTSSSKTADERREGGGVLQTPLFLAVNSIILKQGDLLIVLTGEASLSNLPVCRRCTYLL